MIIILCPVHCKMLSSSCDNQKRLQILPNAPWEAKSALVENHWSNLRTSPLGWKGWLGPHGDAIYPLQSWKGRFPKRLCPQLSQAQEGGRHSPPSPWPLLGWREPCLPEMAEHLASLLSCTRLGANTLLLRLHSMGAGERGRSWGYTP